MEPKLILKNVEIVTVGQLYIKKTEFVKMSRESNPTFFSGNGYKSIKELIYTEELFRESYLQVKKKQKIFEKLEKKKQEDFITKLTEKQKAMFMDDLEEAYKRRKTNQSNN